VAAAPPLYPGQSVAEPAETATSAQASATLRRGGAFVLFAQAVKLILQLGATAVLARLLSPEEFGLISLVTPLVAFFTVFRDIGLTAATIYNDDITDAEVSSLFWINSAAGVVLAASICLLAPLVASFYHDHRLTALLSVMAATFIINGIGAQYQALLQRLLRFKALTVIDVVSNLIGTAIGIVAALRGAGYWSLVLIPVFTQVFSLAFTVCISRWHPQLPRWERRTGTMARFGSAVTGFNLLNYFARNADNLLIGKWWGLEALGYYGRAYSLMMAPLSQVIYPLNQVVVPVLTRLNREPLAYAATYRGLMRQIMLVCVPLVTWLIVGRYWLIELLLGSRWRAVVTIFLPLAFAALVQPMNNSAGWLMMSQGRARHVFQWGVIGGVLTVASLLLGLPAGAQGVAISYAAVQVAIVTPLLWWFACRGSSVRMSDLFAAAAPLWAIGACCGLTFEWVRLLCARWNIEWSAPAGLAIAFVWIFGGSGLLLMSFRSGRQLLSTAASGLRSMLRRPSD